MKIEGVLTVAAPLARVWPALLDPAVMAACIPGCSGIEVVSPTEYRGTISMKFGPIEPRFEVAVSITKVVEGVSIASTTSGQEGSRASMLSSENLLTVRAASPQSTEVAYQATVSVTGRLGKFGLGLMKKTAEKLALEFGQSLSAALTQSVADDAGPAAAAPEAPAHGDPPQEPLSAAGQQYADLIMGLGADIPAEAFAYGEAAAQTLLVCKADQPDGRVLLFWHGGGWTNGYKEWMKFMAPALNRAGITFVSAGYRLAPEHVFPAGFEDCAAAVAWVHARIAGFGGDPGQLYIGGHSAGGHLAALLAVRQDWQAPLDLPTDVIRGCLPVSGVYDFGEGSGLSMRPRFLGPGPTEREASPLHWINGSTRLPPFLAAHGSRDFPHLVTQARQFAQALEAAGARVSSLELPGQDHFATSIGTADPAGRWFTQAIGFMAASDGDLPMQASAAIAIATESPDIMTTVSTLSAVKPQGAPPMFSFTNVCFDYALPGGKSLPVIDRTSFELRRGEVVSVLGPSGCGKSTLLQIGAGLMSCKSGKVQVNGEDTTGIPGKTGFMMQRDELLPWRTVLENVLLGPEVVNGRVTEADRQRALGLLRIAGLLSFEHHYPSALSGGMRQRAAFVRTLMLDRPLVLLDEPFGALDAITRAEMQQWLLDMREELNQTLLLITHDIDEAIFLSDRVLVMSSRPGRIALTLDVPFERPRRYDDIVMQPEYGALKSQLLRAIHPRNATVPA